MAALKITIFDQAWKANFTNAQEALVKNALSQRYGYTANIMNPAFNPALPVSPENSPVIPNPVPVEDFVAKAILQDLIGSGKMTRLSEVQQAKQMEANQQVTTEFSNITYDEIVP
jgi:hypothetical protein